MNVSDASWKHKAKMEGSGAQEGLFATGAAILTGVAFFCAVQLWYYGFSVIIPFGPMFVLSFYLGERCFRGWFYTLRAWSRKFDSEHSKA